MDRIGVSILVGTVLLIAAPADAQQTSSAPLPVVGPSTQPLRVMFSPPFTTITCDTPPGTVIFAVSASGGDGNPVTFTLDANPDYVLVNGNQIVVQPAGITSRPPGCGLEPLNVTASQD